MVYDNETVQLNRSFKVVYLVPQGLKMSHEDFAPEETATFLQKMANPGSVDANTTVKVWIYYYDPSKITDPDEPEEIEATEPPKSEIIPSNTEKTIDLLWSVPSFMGACEYTDPTRYITNSSCRPFA